MKTSSNRFTAKVQQNPSNRVLFKNFFLSYGDTLVFRIPHLLGAEGR